MKKLLAVFLFTLFSVDLAVAQRCPTYPARDRENIRRLFSESAGVPPIQVAGGIQQTLLRLNEMAYLASFPFLSYPTQRQAFQMEYQALLSFIDEVGSASHPALTPAGRRFVRQVVSTAGLGIAGTTLTGASAEKAIANSQEAHSALSRAVSELWRCF